MARLALGFLLLCFVWGTSWVAIKFSLEGFPPFFGASLRFAAASGLLFMYARWKGIRLSVARVDRRTILVTAFLVYVLDYGLIYWAEQWLNAGVTAIFFSTFPLFTGVFANFLFRSEPFRGRVQAGLVLGFAGVIVIFHHELGQTRFDPLVAAAAGGVLVAAAAGAVSSLIVKRSLSKANPVALSLHQMILGTAALFAISLVLGEWRDVRFVAGSLVAVAYLGVMASAVAFALYYWLLQNLSAITLSLVVFITPVVAVVFDWLLLDKSVSLQTLLGMAVILSGVALSQSHHYRVLLRRSRA